MEPGGDRSGLSFDRQVAVVTGAGRGLGRRYALDLAAAGASVVVNVRRREVADEVVAEIEAEGGRAVPAVCDARDGERIVATAIERFGRIDVLVANAGAVRDRTFRKLEEADWNDVLDVHLGGAYRLCAAAWPRLIEQGSGSVVLTASGAGLHGNFGQANYAAAKGGIIALAKTLAAEGARYGIRVNAIAPMAATDMTRDVFGAGGPLAELRADQVSPFVVAVAHDSCPLSGQVIEVGGGWASVLRWERSAGIRLAGDFAPADVADRWTDITDFEYGADHPTSTGDSLAAACEGPPRTSTI